MNLSLIVLLLASVSWAGGIKYKLTDKPRIVNLPGTGAHKLPYCVAPFHDEEVPELSAVFHVPFDSKKGKCPEEYNDYQKAKDDFVIAYASVPVHGAPKSESMTIGNQQFQYRVPDWTNALAYPVEGGDPTKAKWNVVCATQSYPKGKESQSPLNDTITFCPKSAPEGQINGDDVKHMLEKGEITCPFPGRCKETEIPTASVEEYVKKQKEEQSSVNRLLKSGVGDRDKKDGSVTIHQKREDNSTDTSPRNTEGTTKRPIAEEPTKKDNP